MHIEVYKVFAYLISAQREMTEKGSNGQAPPLRLRERERESGEVWIFSL